jgi:uncharacterized protein YjiK
MKYFILLISVLSALMFTSCQESKEVKDEKLPAELIASYKTKVPEPSDLCLSFDKKALWTVSDEENSAYLISFDGNILQTIKLKGEDPEGITVINDSTFAVVFDRERIFAKYSLNGDELFRKKFEEFKGDLNAGFEGLTLNTKNGHYFIVNEKLPRLLIELDADLNVVVKTELTDTEDYSGVFYDDVKDQLWLISDENNAIMQCNFDGSIKESFRVTVPQMEGIAVDHKSKRIYTISDITGELFVYQILD